MSKANSRRQSEMGVYYPCIDFQMHATFVGLLDWETCYCVHEDKASSPVHRETDSLASGLVGDTKPQSCDKELPFHEHVGKAARADGERNHFIKETAPDHFTLAASVAVQAFFSLRTCEHMRWL